MPVRRRYFASSPFQHSKQLLEPPPLRAPCRPHSIPVLGLALALRWAATERNSIRRFATADSPQPTRRSPGVAMKDPALPVARSPEPIRHCRPRQCLPARLKRRWAEKNLLAFRNCRRSRCLDVMDAPQFPQNAIVIAPFLVSLSDVFAQPHAGSDSRSVIAHRLRSRTSRSHRT